MHLRETMTYAFSKSKKWFRFSIGANIIVAIASITVAFDLSKSWISSLAILSVIIQVSSFVFRIQAEKTLELAEEVKRHFILSDGIGLTPDPLEIKRLNLEIGTIVPKIAYSSPYYESTSPIGPKKLVEILHESAFFTCGLSTSASNFFFVVSSIAVGLSILSIIIVASYFTNSTEINSFTSSILPLMGFWASSDFLNLAIKFSSLKNSANKVCYKTNFLLAKNVEPTEAEALIAFSEYCCYTAAAPPIPEKIYTNYKDSLNVIWNNNKKM